jgi:sporulation protein YlmC with PRC-barrel domain
MSDTTVQPSDTSGNLIAASKVTGTSVYDRDGEKLGSIYDVMIDKSSGATRYAVMNFGGLFGIGEHYHPLPWNVLRYDSELGGYVVDIDRSKLEGAPSYETSDTALWGEDTWGGRVNDHYGRPTENDIGFGSASVPGVGSHQPLV